MMQTHCALDTMEPQIMLPRTDDPSAQQQPHHTDNLTVSPPLPQDTTTILEPPLTLTHSPPVRPPWLFDTFVPALYPHRPDIPLRPLTMPPLQPAAHGLPTPHSLQQLPPQPTHPSQLPQLPRSFPQQSGSATSLPLFGTMPSMQPSMQPSVSHAAPHSFRAPMQQHDLTTPVQQQHVVSASMPGNVVSAPQLSAIQRDRFLHPSPPVSVPRPASLLREQGSCAPQRDVHFSQHPFSPSAQHQNTCYSTSLATAGNNTPTTPTYSQGQVFGSTITSDQHNPVYTQPSISTPQPTPTNPPTPVVPLNVRPPQSHDQIPINPVSVLPTIPRDAAVVQYWKRLEALLTSARAFAQELQPSRTSLSRPCETPRQIAYDLQGLTASAADAHVAKQPQHYRTAYETRAAGDFIEYGVASAHAVWAAQVLAVVLGTSPLTAVLPDAPLTATCPDKAVEDVRVRVFEAEVSCLPVEFVEVLLKRRRSMRKFKNRIDLCVRILLALEGRGRRPTQASLDRVKLQLEKADIQARAEAEREAVRKERERQKYERVKKHGVKAEDNKKRKRQQSAQAHFMMRFVKKDDKDKDSVDEEDVVVVQTTREGYAAPLGEDRDVMSVAWWLRTEMPSAVLHKLDDLFNTQREEKMTLKEIADHLAECAKQRELAERRIHGVLREYRQQRKTHVENRTPMFASRRADVRGRGTTGPVKLLQFDENYRPAFFGTFSRRSPAVSGRRPFGKDSERDYECDSSDEWDEDEEGEDLLDVEADKELASEEAELRRLYGSDDEDDDDFLDDGDVEDDEDDGGNRDDEEHGTASGPASQEVASPLKGNGGSSEVSDLALVTVNESKSERLQKRPAKDDMRKRSGKRRKGVLKQSVIIYNVSIPDGEPSPLDRFAVNAFEGSQPIQMFNPFVYTSSDIVAEHLKAKPPSLKTTRASNMDESTKLDLAAALMRTGSTKDKIILQFCEHRKMRGLAVPAKAEITRALGEIATKEKRDGDTRALWHLTDQSIARKVAQMNNSVPAALPHASASVIVD